MDTARIVAENLLKIKAVFLKAAEYNLPSAGGEQDEGRY